MHDLIRSTIMDWVARECEDGFQREALLRVLQRPGFALHPDAPCRTGILTVEAYRLAAGVLDEAGLLAGAAVELQMEAGFMLDNVADGEAEGDVAQEMALALSMLYSGISAANSAVSKAGVSGARGCHLLREASAACVKACAGQLLDAVLAGECTSTSEQAIQMTCLKSGSLGRFAAAFGAGLATGDEALVSLFGDFGFNIFAYLQLIDDLRDFRPCGAPYLDAESNKKTLPLTFFWTSLRNAAHSDIIEKLALPASRVLAAETATARKAELFTAIAAEAFLNRAKDRLASINGILGTTGVLSDFVENVEEKSSDALAGIGSFAASSS